MDPVILATVTSAILLIATEVMKGAAGDAGKTLWSNIKGMFGWSQDPSLPDLAPQIATRLAKDPELTKKLVELLQKHPEESPMASTLVGKIDAQKVVVVGTMNVSGDFNMN